MAVAAYAIVSLTEVKNFLGIGDQAADTARDTLLEGWIDRCSHEIESYTGRKFAQQSITQELHDGNGLDRLYTKFFPITQLSTETTPSDAQKLAAVQYTTDYATWSDIEDDINYLLIDSDWPFVRLTRTVFPAGERNVRVSYKAGYSTVPGDVWRVALEMVAMMWKRSKISGEDALGKQTRSTSGVGSNYTESFMDMDEQWRRVLNRYKIPSRITGGQIQLTR